MDYKPEESLGRWISIIDRCASRFARRRLRPHGIGKNHLFFLGTLVREGDDISQEELAARLHMDRGATTRSLSTLEREGYVRRLANRGDARARRILLTAKARRRWPRIVEDLQSWNQVLTEGFTAAQRKEAGLLLSRMATNAMESVERDRGPGPAKRGTVQAPRVRTGRAAPFRSIRSAGAKLQREREDGTARGPHGRTEPRSSRGCGHPHDIATSTRTRGATFSCRAYRAL